MKQLREIFSKASPELVKKFRSCNSADEVISVAKEEDIDLTKDQAQTLILVVTEATGEIPEDELDNISGGTKERVNGNSKICPICQSTKTTVVIDQQTGGFSYSCQKCHIFFK